MKKGLLVLLALTTVFAFSCKEKPQPTPEPPEEEVLTVPQKKDVVFSLIREDRWPKYKEAISERFSVSKMAKGISYAIPLDSVAGVSIYKMLTNTRLFEKPTSAAKGKKGKKSK